LFDGAQFWLRERHLNRMARSAQHFGFVFDLAKLEEALEMWRLNAPPKKMRVRLLLGAEGHIRFESTELGEDENPQSPVVVPLAKKPIPRHNPLMFHKTTRREEYDAQARDFPGAFDVLLWNDQGEITEFTRGNVVVEMAGRRLTPPVDCGLLGGTFREELISRGEVVEQVLSREDILSAQRIWFVNSVRGWVEVVLDDYDHLGHRSFVNLDSSQ
jgi:para-aminobenzoate synthetase/4-amino-4-deoxychorismate lyase